MPGVIQGKSEMAEAVNDGEPKDGLIFANKTFRQDRAKNRKEINRRDEEREILPRLRVAHVIGRTAAR